MGLFSDIWDGIGSFIGPAVGAYTGIPGASQAVNFLGDELWGQDAPLPQGGESAPTLPPVDDYSNGYGNSSMPGIPSSFPSISNPGSTSLPAVDDYSNGYGQSSMPGYPPIDWSAFTGALNTAAQSSAASASDMFKSAMSGFKDFSSALAPLGPAISSAMGYKGAADVNATNLEIASKANEFNAGQAQLNRDWMSTFNAGEAEKARSFSAAQAAKAMEFSERMSNTQWQRSTQDMMAAGLNPMLAYMKGPNSSPSGFAGSGSSASVSGGFPTAVVPQVANKLAAGMHSGLSAASTMATINEAEARTGHVSELERVAKVEANRIVADTAWIWSKRDVSSQEYVKLKEEVRKVIAETGLIGQQEHKVVQEVVKILTDTDLSVAQRRNVIAHALLMELDAPRARNEAGAQSSWWKTNVSPYLPDVLKSVGSAAGAARLFGR